MARWIGLALVLAVATTAAAAPETVWQIGKPDRSYMEFAIAKNYAAWETRFGAKDPVFAVGKSDPAKDWPFIHPGPSDPWAGGREHPLTIRFGLEAEPRGVFTLRIEFADVHARETPTYGVRVGGRSGEFRLQPGGGDGSLTDPAVGKPQKLELVLPAEVFKKGPNEIVVTSTRGSWVQYDAITLLQDADGKMPEAEIQSVTATATPFFVRSGGEVGRAIEVAVSTTAPAAEIAIRVEAAGKQLAAVEGGPGGVLAPGAGSLAAVAEPNVRLVAAKRAETGAGLVLRLWEVGGRATTAHVRLPQMKPTKATACNLVEESQGALEIEDGAISVPVRGRGLATVLVE